MNNREKNLLLNSLPTSFQEKVKSLEIQIHVLRFKTDFTGELSIKQLFNIMRLIMSAFTEKYDDQLIAKRLQELSASRKEE